jgi:hypothetical protein
VDYDYNCDNVEEQYYTSAGVAAGADCGFVIAPTALLPGPIIRFCPGDYGYTDVNPPGCGKSAEYTYCASDCTRIFESRQQSCR